MREVERYWKSSDVQFPLPHPSEYRLRHNRPVKLAITNPYTFCKEVIYLLPIGHHVAIRTRELALTFSELAFLYDKANYGLRSPNMARRYDMSAQTINNTLETAAKRNGKRVEAVAIEAEKQGLLHPDLVPYIRNTFLTRALPGARLIA